MHRFQAHTQGIAVLCVLEDARSGTWTRATGASDACVHLWSWHAQDPAPRKGCPEGAETRTTLVFGACSQACADDPPWPAPSAGPGTNLCPRPGWLASVPEWRRCSWMRR